MKKLFCIFLSLMLSFTLMTAQACAQSLNVPSNILVLGDSIATGYELEGYELGRENTDNYANQVARHYELTDSLSNLALDGQTSNELLDKIKDGRYDARFETADLIIISIGGNDLLHYVLGVICNALDISDISQIETVDYTDPAVLLSVLTALSDDTFTEKIEAIVTGFETAFIEIYQLVKEKAPDANIIFQTIYDPFDQNELFTMIDTVANSVLNNFNRVIRNNATDAEGNEVYKVCDVALLFEGRGSDLTNIESYDIHPNRAGHDEIFKALCPLIEDFEYKIDSISADMQNLRRKAAFVCVALVVFMVAIIVIYIVRKTDMFSPKVKVDFSKIDKN